MIYIIDTETTSIEAPEVIELAWVMLESPFDAKFPPMVYEQRFCPKGPMAFGAMATHHILPQELKDCPASETASIPPDCTYMIGHNVDFDYGAILLKPPGIKRIDTLAIARALYPTLDSHTLGALTYFFAPFTSEVARERLRGAHSALTDVRLCLEILLHLIKNIDDAHRPDTAEALWEFSEDCRIPRVMPFGKYKGIKIVAIPPDYMRWAEQQVNFDPYVLKAFRLARDGKLT